MTLSADLQRELERAEVDYDVIEHTRTERATDEAKAIGVPPEAVAKTVVIATGNGYARAVVAASNQLNMNKVRDILGGGKNVRLATEAELVVAYPMYELGAVPPFGLPAGDRVLLDQELAQRDSVIIEAGSHNESLRMKTSDLLTLTRAEVVDIAGP